MSDEPTLRDETAPPARENEADDDIRQAREARDENARLRVELANAREDYAEVALERDELKAELRKYVPSDGVMHQRLGDQLAIDEAATLFEQWQAGNLVGRESIATWLALPAVVHARKAMKR